MNINDIVNRYSLLYGDEHPLIKELERSFNATTKSEQFSSLFKVATEFAMNDDLRPHAEMVRDTLGEASNIHDIVDVITGNKYHIPQGFKQLLYRFEGPILNDAFSQGQIQSKLWVADTLNTLDIDLGQTTYVCAGWYGLLSAILLERCPNKLGKILSFDIDERAENPADMLNIKYVMDDTRFKAVTKDIQELEYRDDEFEVTFYQYTDHQNYKIEVHDMNVRRATCVINTSCEHIEDFDDWWDNIPDGMLVIMQNNNFTEHNDDTVCNTVPSEQRWVDKLDLDELYYRGTLELPKYKRFMVIGRK